MRVRACALMTMEKVDELLRGRNGHTVVTLLTFLVLLQDTCGKTTCFAPPAVLDETAVVTCSFGYDITDTSDRFSVRVRRIDHDDHDYRRDTVLDCDWEGDKWKCMTVMAGYKFNYQVSTYLTVLVPNFSHNHTGRYVCQLVPPDPEGSDPCELSVADEVTDTEAPATVYEDKPKIINLKSQLTMDAQKSPSIEEKTSTEKRPVTPIVVGVALPVVVILSVIILAVLVKYTALGKRIWKRLKFPRVGPSKEQQISKTQNVEDKSPTETASPLVTKPCQNGTPEHTTEPDETSVMLDTDEKSAEEKSESDSGYQVEGGLHRSKSTECVSPSKPNNRNSSGDLKSRSVSFDALNESQDGGILQKAFSSMYYMAERATNAIFPIASLLGQNDSMQSSSKDPYEV